MENRTNINDNRLKITTNKSKSKSKNKSSKRSKSASAIDQNSKPKSKSKSSSTSLTISLSVPKSSTNENNCKNNIKISDEKKSNYNIHSRRSLFKDIRNTAMNKLTSMRNGFSTISSFLTKSNKSNDNDHYARMQQISSPIKLYSPFTIETPPPIVDEQRRKYLRQQLFSSPTNQLKNDLENLNEQIYRLNLFAATVNDNNNHNDNDDENVYINHQQSINNQRHLMNFSLEENLI